MYEELLIKSGSLKTEYDFIYKATDPRLKKGKIDEIIQQLTLALTHDNETIKQFLAKIGIGYSGN